jgi:hypothetical protein
MANDHDDAFDEDGLLRDGCSFRVPHWMLDSLQRDVAAHAASAIRPRDSAAFPRPRRGTCVTDQWGGTAGLHRPGYRFAAGGSVGDAMLRESNAEEVQAAYDIYAHRLTTAWRDTGNDENEDELVEVRRSAVCSALMAAGGNASDIEEYIEDLDDDALLSGDVSDHVEAFQRRSYSSDSLERLYRERDAALSRQWRSGR